MRTWEEYYRVDRKENSGVDFSDWLDTYQIVVISTNEVVGTYKDYKYARKQAKHKFKKIVKRVERILLG